MTPTRLFEELVESAVGWAIFKQINRRSPVERCLVRGEPIPDEHLPGRLLERLLSKERPEHRVLLRDLTGAMTAHAPDRVRLALDLIGEKLIGEKLKLNN